MSALRFLLAFAAGAWLYYVAVVLIAGFIAAMPVPIGYFRWFGRPHLELALASLNLVSFALPIALLVAGGTLAVLRVLAGNTRVVLLATFLGLIASFAYTVADFALHVPAELPAPALPPSALLLQSLFPPWWAVSGVLAPWVGFAFAVRLSARKCAT